MAEPTFLVIEFKRETTDHAVFNRETNHIVYFGSLEACNEKADSLNNPDEQLGLDVGDIPEVKRKNIFNEEE